MAVSNYPPRTPLRGVTTMSPGVSPAPPPRLGYDTRPGAPAGRVDPFAPSPGGPGLLGGPGLGGAPPAPGMGAGSSTGNQSFGGYGNFQYGPPTIADRGMAEGQGIRNMMMGGQAGFAGNMQNAMGQIFMTNQLNAERASENRRTDAISRIFGGGQAPQFGMPNVALPSGGVTQGGVYSSPYQGVTPAGPEGLTGGASQQYSDAFGANAALAGTRTDLAGSEADAQYALAARMADSDVMRQLTAMQTQQQGNQMGYNQGLQRLMAAIA